MLKNLNSKILVFTLIFILFFPSKHLYFFYFFVFSFSFGFLLKNVSYLKTSVSLNLLLLILVGVIFSSLLPVMFLGSNISKNLTEVLRFLPVIFILLSFYKVDFPYKSLVIVFSSYTIINFIVSFLQFNNSAAIGFVGNIYSSELHVKSSLGIANRALGLSSGPGSNGAISAILCIFFIVTYFFQKDFKKTSIVLYLLSFSNILLSQSQTAFVSVLLITFLVIIFFIIKFIKRKSIVKVLPFLAVILGGGLWAFNKYMEQLRYLSTLFEMGLSRSSYEAREDKVGLIWDLVTQRPFFLFFGHGKDFVPYSSGMDNEYIFIIAVYGLFTLLAFIIWYLYSFMFLFLYKNIYGYLVVFTLACGLVIAWPSAFISDPRLMFIFCLYIALCLNFSYKEKEGLVKYE
ncbi:hypothetical protein [Acinetobacter indicus]|uniref:hypothetical protein n=1 Tax=Acinetobacter indicus TaxID=756892 RepID=UPI000CEC4E14|nr:hypothetical protein [Acinetobacter indicus]